MHFYELHEGDDELYSDVLLGREEEMPADDFFELVQGLRKQLQGHHEEDTLIEAIALEPGRNHPFRFIPVSRRPAAGLQRRGWESVDLGGGGGALLFDGHPSVLRSQALRRSVSATSATNTSSMVLTSAPLNIFIDESICWPSPPAPTISS